MDAPMQDDQARGDLRRACREGPASDLGAHQSGVGSGQARGVVLGNPALADMNQRRRTAAVARAEELRPLLQKLNGEPLRAIAAELDARRIAASTGARWSAVTVKRLQQRLGLASAT